MPTAVDVSPAPGAALEQFPSLAVAGPRFFDTSKSIPEVGIYLTIQILWLKFL